MKNLPYDVNEEGVNEALAGCGRIASVRLAMWNHTRKLKVQAERRWLALICMRHVLRCCAVVLLLFCACAFVLEALRCLCSARSGRVIMHNGVYIGHRETQLSWR